MSEQERRMSETACSGYVIRKCIGLWGRMVGHRFKFRLASTIYDSDTCSRCGVRRDS